ncbi:MAG: hypothetical protein DRP37_06415 [Thermodesulfobacteriota bacterium]|nr:MAG: hypothetical protein DRP37_06415 [Thermodesulfobacteriota bacterium]
MPEIPNKAYAVIGMKREGKTYLMNIMQCFQKTVLERPTFFLMRSNGIMPSRCKGYLFCDRSRDYNAHFTATN